METVINMSLPRQLSQYVHRVGRTARAGRAGRSITLVDESQRKLLKDIVKQAKEVVKSRSVPQPVIARYKAAIEALEPDVEEVIKQEKYEKYLRMTAIEADAAVNKIKHREEILSRPAKTWYCVTLPTPHHIISYLVRSVVSDERERAREPERGGRVSNDEHNMHTNVSIV